MRLATIVAYTLFDEMISEGLLHYWKHCDVKTTKNSTATTTDNYFKCNGTYGDYNNT